MKHQSMEENIENIFDENIGTAERMFDSIKIAWKKLQCILLK